MADLAWGRVVSESRRMAAHLRSLGFPEGARIAILSKNTAVLARIPARVLDLLLGVPVVSGVVRRRILASFGLDQCRCAAGGAAHRLGDGRKDAQRLTSVSHTS